MENYLFVIYSFTLLRSLCQRRQYAEIASLLQGVSKVMEHFNPYLDIPQVKELAEQVTGFINIFTLNGFVIHNCFTASSH